MSDDNKTKVISLADAMAQIESLEARVMSCQICIAELYNSVAELEAMLPSATQVAEAA